MSDGLLPKSLFAWATARQKNEHLNPKPGRWPVRSLWLFFERAKLTQKRIFRAKYRPDGFYYLTSPGFGGMAEWLKAAVLKTVSRRRDVGSNPTPSAKEFDRLQQEQDLRGVDHSIRYHVPEFLQPIGIIAIYLRCCTLDPGLMEYAILE